MRTAAQQKAFARKHKHKPNFILLAGKVTCILQGWVGSKYLLDKAGVLTVKHQALEAQRAAFRRAFSWVLSLGKGESSCWRGDPQSGGELREVEILVPREREANQCGIPAAERSC